VLVLQLLEQETVVAALVVFLVLLVELVTLAVIHRLKDIMAVLVEILDMAVLVLVVVPAALVLIILLVRELHLQLAAVQ
jgi:hypothetical protein